ncbi:MAG: P-loop NTPase [Pseudomonadota bacterium]
MSKVQKALRRIREGRSEAISEREKARRQRAYREDDAAYDSGYERQSPESPKKGAGIIMPEVNETASLPRVTIPEAHIDWVPELLEEYGLRLSDADNEATASSYRQIKRPIIANAFSKLETREENANVVMISSPLPGAGKSFCSYSLALSIAKEKDITAVLVDADVLKPTVSRAFGIDDRIGLTDYLEDDASSIDDILVKVGEEGILTIPAGSLRPNSTELLASKRMRKFVRSLSHNFSQSVVIVDTPPLLLTTEAQALTDHVGQLCLVVEAGETSHEQFLEVLESIDRSKPVNAILNKSRISTAGGYGGQYYGYGYGK